MHSTIHALPKRAPLDLSNCFVRNPSYWCVLFPDCHSPVVVDAAPPVGHGKIIGTAHTPHTACRICSAWIEQAEERKKKRTNALIALAGAIFFAALMVAVS